jgi:hypothetical protein
MSGLRKMIAQSLTGAVLASVACVVYDMVYSNAMYVDFSSVLSIPSAIIASCVSVLLMNLGYWVVQKRLGQIGLGIANLVYCILSFGSIIGIFAIKLPLELESPEMFAGLAIPMHFFPLLAFLSVLPFFNRTKVSAV